MLDKLDDGVIADAIVDGDAVTVVVITAVRIGCIAFATPAQI